jgi:hypothetical protein
MRFYWSAKSVPELRHLPPEVRHWVVHHALGTTRVTFWSGLLVVAFLLGGIALGIMAGITIGDEAGLLVGEALCLLAYPLLLNVARPRIRELLQRR